MALPSIPAPAAPVALPNGNYSYTSTNGTVNTGTKEVIAAQYAKEQGTTPPGTPVTPIVAPAAGGVGQTDNGTGKPTEPTVVSSDNITSNVIPDNNAKLDSLATKGTFVGQDGKMVYADGSLVPAPTDFTGAITLVAVGQGNNSGTGVFDGSITINP